jgi:DNA repair protein RecO (recombination protein O)
LELTLKSKLENAYILHQRPYRETSLLLDLFSREQGVRRVVAKGVRGKKRSQAGLLQAYQPLWVSWVGRSELQTLTASESAGPRHALQGNANLCGLYLNELLLRLLATHDPAESVFQLYENTLTQLAECTETEIVLRLFEKRLLHALGYALALTHESDTHLARGDETQYYYQPTEGLRLWHAGAPAAKISGRALRQLDEETDFDLAGLLEIKQLMRGIMQFYLGDKPLRSRQLFAEMNAMRPQDK